MGSRITIEVLFIGSIKTPKTTENYRKQPKTTENIAATVPKTTENNQKHHSNCTENDKKVQKTLQ